MDIDVDSPWSREHENIRISCHNHKNERKNSIEKLLITWHKQENKVFLGRQYWTTNFSYESWRQDQWKVNFQLNILSVNIFSSRRYVFNENLILNSKGKNLTPSDIIFHPTLSMKLNAFLHAYGAPYFFFYK